MFYEIIDFMKKKGIRNFINKRIALVMPKYGFILNDVKKERANRVPPLGLYSIMNNIKDIIKCKIFDSNLYINQNQLIEEIKLFLGEGDILGLSCYTTTYPLSVKLLDFFPSESIFKILGGPYITYMPDLRYAHMNIRGEGEIPLRQFIINPYDIFNISGVYFYSKGKIYDNGIFIHGNLDAIKDPDYASINWFDYYASPMEKFNVKIGHIISSRGCNKCCTFCDKVRKKQICINSDRIIKHISAMKSIGIRTIKFWDDNLLSRPKANLEKILSYMGEQNINYTCFGRADEIDHDMMKMLKNTGCKQIWFGLESGDESIQKFYNKKINVRDVEKTICLTHSNGIRSVVSAIIGAPMETDGTICKTVNIIKYLNPTLYGIHILNVNPGAKIYKYAVEKGLIILEQGRYEADYDKYGLEEVMGLPPISRITFKSSSPSYEQLRQEKYYLNNKKNKAYEILGMY